jgi:hypothetical protein
MAADLHRRGSCDLIRLTFNEGIKGEISVQVARRPTLANASPVQAAGVPPLTRSADTLAAPAEARLLFPAGLRDPISKLICWIRPPLTCAHRVEICFS